MNKILKLIISIIILVAIILGATLLYNHLTKKYEADNSSLTEETEKETTKAVDFTVESFDGNAVNLSDKFGKPLVVNFWATWCGPCKSEMPLFNRLYNEYKGKVNFMMINLTDGFQDTKEKVKEFIDNSGYEFPVYYDTKQQAAYTYGVSSIPATLFIDSDGEITRGILGAMDEKSLRNFIEELLGDK